MRLSCFIPQALFYLEGQAENDLAYGALKTKSDLFNGIAVFFIYPLQYGNDIPDFVPATTVTKLPSRVFASQSVTNG